MAKVNLNVLVVEETAKVKAYYDKHPEALAHGFDSHEAYVRYVLDIHRSLVEHWGGWRFHGPPVRAEFSRETTIRDTVREAVGAATKERKLQPVANAPWPAITANWELLRTPRLVSEVPFRELEYAAGRTVRVAAGQSVARAIMMDVKKNFSEQPDYVALWERLLVALGHRWAQGEPIAVSLTVAPTSFLKLGQYGEGENNPYKTGKAGEHTRVNLSLVPDSALAVFYSGDKALQPKPQNPNDARAGKISGHSLGIFHASGGAVFGNILMEEWARVAPALAATISEAIGVPGVIMKDLDAPEMDPLLSLANGQAGVFSNIPSKVFAQENHREVSEGVISLVTDFVAGERKIAPAGERVVGKKKARGVVECHGCGNRILTANARYCSACGNAETPLCADCGVRCEECDDNYCVGCYNTTHDHL